MSLCIDLTLLKMNCRSIGLPRGRFNELYTTVDVVVSHHFHRQTWLFSGKSFSAMMVIFFLPRTLLLESNSNFVERERENLHFCFIFQSLITCSSNCSLSKVVLFVIKLPRSWFPSTPPHAHCYPVLYHRYQFAFCQLYRKFAQPELISALLYP